jgi:hypothetical protein
MAITFLALGLLERDSLTVAVGLVVAGVGIAVVIAASVGVVHVLTSF